MADLPIPHMEEPLAELERLLIAEFIRNAGEDPDDVHLRQDERFRALRADASAYAASRLSEVEARLHYLRSLRGQE
jgi:hypothetical protein